MMHTLGHLIRIGLAVMVVAVLLIVGFSVFMVLLGVAAVVAGWMWLRNRGVFGPRPEWTGEAAANQEPGEGPPGEEDRAAHRRESVTIIEGEAEEIDEREPGQSSSTRGSGDASP